MINTVGKEGDKNTALKHDSKLYSVYCDDVLNFLKEERKNG